MFSAPPVIDTFINAHSAEASTSSDNFAVSSLSGIAVVGGVRDLFSVFVSGDLSALTQVTTNRIAGFTTGSATNGYGMIEWDGVAGVNYTLNDDDLFQALLPPSMTLGTDLTGCGDEFVFSMRGDGTKDTTVRMEVYTSASAWSYEELTLFGNGALQTLSFKFDDFDDGGSSGATFINVNAIRLFFNYGVVTNVSTTTGSPIFTGCDLDWGDAPDAYGTTLVVNGPSHAALANLYLGEVPPDLEEDGLPGTSADGDDNNQTLNDEDGVTSFVASQTVSEGVVTNQIVANVDVTNSTDANAALCAFLDVDVNNAFAFEGAAGGRERKCSTIATSGSLQNSTVTWSTTSLTSGLQFSSRAAKTSYARFRLCSGTVTTNDCDRPTSFSASGEIEDYVTSFDFRFNWGDAPDSYGTDRASSGEGVGPHHVVPGTPLRLSGIFRGIIFL